MRLGDRAAMSTASVLIAADHQGVKEDWEKQREVFGDLQRLREVTAQHEPDHLGEADGATPEFIVNNENGAASDITRRSAVRRPPALRSRDR